MTKRPASSSLDGLRGSRARNEDDPANELPSWFETFVKSDDDRDRLMKELIYENRCLKQNIEYLNTEIYDDPDFEARKNGPFKADKKLTADKNGTKSVVLVLIDGNKCVFRPELIEQGAIGGVEAAQWLRKEIVQCISKPRNVNADCEIFLRIYVDVGWLLWKFPNLGSGLDKKALRPFIQGLNQIPQLQMIDVSSTYIYGKIRGDLNSYISIGDFTHVLLGDDITDTDMGLLETISGKPPILTLIQPFQPQTPLKLSPNVVTFPTVFITEDTPQIETNDAPPTHIHHQPAPPSPPRSKPPPPPPPPPPPSPLDSPCTTPRPFFPAPILLNKHAQRIDAPLPPLGPAGWAYITRIQSHPAEKVCNDHHLLGHCHLGPECMFSHREVEHDVRLAMVRGMRGIPCRLGSGCRNRNCLLGHVCPYPRCGERGRKCRFEEEAHKVEEEGTWEWKG